MGCIAGSAHLHGVRSAKQSVSPLSQLEKAREGFFLFAASPRTGDIPGQLYTYKGSDFSVEIHRAPTAHTYS